MLGLDPPLLLYFPRLVLRTFLRRFGIQEVCSDGCPESITKMFFSRESILWYCLRYHWVNKRRGSAKMAIFGLDDGSNVSERKMRRIGGWGGDLNRFLSEVKEFARRS